MWKPVFIDTSAYSKHYVYGSCDTFSEAKHSDYYVGSFIQKKQKNIRSDFHKRESEMLCI